jgi:hypothetical protein
MDIVAQQSNDQLSPCISRADRLLQFSMAMRKSSVGAKEQLSRKKGSNVHAHEADFLEADAFYGRLHGVAGPISRVAMLHSV